MSSFFYLEAEETARNHSFLKELEAYCNSKKKQAYVVSRPLGDTRYNYAQRDSIVVLMPQQKISFIDFAGESSIFDEFVDDFLEDLGSLSDKYKYKDVIGRPRSWRDDLIAKYATSVSVGDLIAETGIVDSRRQRVCELLISLLTGSINDVEKVKADIPDTLLDRVKQKILLFDGDQTRFIYQRPEHSPIRIQGLSGTGKTELLLHKLKDLYVGTTASRIAFTCHNRILADSMRRRIPDFFNFMKVEQQIAWEENLWCMHAWGGFSNIHSGTYRYICHFYGIQFFPFGAVGSFDAACKAALEAISFKSSDEYAFDFMLIDESQDFPESFFDLCCKVTHDTVYIAGDIFQSIFDDAPRTVDSDYLLSKCYRTDPKTLMFAHALGMGLFEPRKLRWLDDDQWKACGYIVEKVNSGGTYRLKREPLRRFEDIDRENVSSVELVKVPTPFYTEATAEIVRLIRQIRENNPTVFPDDIGVIFLDSGQAVYRVADELEQVVPREFGFDVNKAYESKRREKGTLFISNRNNVKGLEFPFVICVCARIQFSPSYRNALYMTLTRSFVQTYLVLSGDSNASLFPFIEPGLQTINGRGYIEVAVPSENERAQIKTGIKYATAAESFFDFLNGIFNEINVLPVHREAMTDLVKKLVGEDFDRENVSEIVAFNYKKLLEREK